MKTNNYVIPMIARLRRVAGLMDDSFTKAVLEEVIQPHPRDKHLFKAAFNSMLAAGELIPIGKGFNYQPNEDLERRRNTIESMFTRQWFSSADVAEAMNEQINYAQLRAALDLLEADNFRVDQMTHRGRVYYRLTQMRKAS